MISTEDIRDKEVINIYDGRSMGYVDDIEINLERGTVEGIVIFGKRGLFGLFGKEEDRVIPWRSIRRIGDDVVLAEVPGSGTREFTYERREKEQEKIQESLA